MIAPQGEFYRLLRGVLSECERHRRPLAVLAAVAVVVGFAARGYPFIQTVAAAVLMISVWASGCGFLFKYECSGGDC